MTILLPMLRLLCLVAFVFLAFSSCRKEDPAHQKQVDINISEPRIGAILEKGKTYPINWVTDKAEKLRIDLYQKEKQVSIIAVSESNSGKFNWLVPHELMPDSNYRIRITAVDNKQISSFSHYFQITGDSTQKYIYTSLLQDNNWIKGQSYPIEWKTNLEEDLKVELLEQNNLVKTISSNAKSNDLLTWTVYQDLPTSSYYRLKISSTVYPDLYTLSNNIRISTNDERNLVPNGNFSSDQYWEYSNPQSDPKNRWNINYSNGIGSAEMVSFQNSGDLYQVMSLTPGKQYRIIYSLERCNGYFGPSDKNDTSNLVASIAFFLGDSLFTKHREEGTFEQSFTAQHFSDTLGFRIITDQRKYPNSGFIGKLGKVELFVQP